MINNNKGGEFFLSNYNMSSPLLTHCGTLCTLPSFNKNNNMKNDTRHVYQKDITLELEYSYNKEYRKVYDIKQLRRQFRNLVANLEQHNKK
tara:strand:+ start:3231 stop:3503 length:273 start_codon:yes stop_codon:yes gene_type:complete